MTLPLIAALREMDSGARHRVEALFAESVPGDADIHAVIGLAAEYGGIDYARRRGEQFAQEAEEALAEIPDTPARAALLDAITYVMDRRF